MPPQQPEPAAPEPETPAAPPSPSVPPAPPTPTSGLPPGVRKEDCELLEPGEEIVMVVHRHPIGIILIYLEAVIGVGAAVALVILLSPSVLQNVSGEAYNVLLGIIVLGIGLVAMILLLATYIYRQSRLVVSDKSLIQVIQKGLFIRRVSRLSMSNVQDVQADHEGFLATVFGYGTLTVETAGEEDNFVFPLCPTPDKYADVILQARQRYAHTEGAKEGI